MTRQTPGHRRSCLTLFEEDTPAVGVPTPELFGDNALAARYFHFIRVAEPKIARCRSVTRRTPAISKK